VAGPSGMPFMPGAPSPNVPQGKPIPWWEDVAVILAIVCIWPVVLKWPNPCWRYFMYVMAVLMVVVFFRRKRRLQELARPQRESGGFPPGGGGGD